MGQATQLFQGTQAMVAVSCVILLKSLQFCASISLVGPCQSLEPQLSTILLRLPSEVPPTCADSVLTGLGHHWGGGTLLRSGGVARGEISQHMRALAPS